LEFNKDKVIKITSEISASVRRLEELQGLPKDLFLADPHKVGSAKNNLIVAVEGIIDLCNHIIAKNRWRAPEDYADTFRAMAERGAFDPGFTQRLIQMSRFRNRLVHIYWQVDEEELHRILQSCLEDVRTFLREFGTFLSK